MSCPVRRADEALRDWFPRVCCLLRQRERTLPPARSRHGERIASHLGGAGVFRSAFNTSIKLLALEYPDEMEEWNGETWAAAQVRPDFFRLSLDLSGNLVLWDVYEVEESCPVSKIKLGLYSDIALRLEATQHGVFNSLTIIDPLENRQVFTEWQMMVMGMRNAVAA